MKEMVGGCCVCADESGWPDNPLVYCDGLNCTVAVHQGCYGILKVPEGNWYCAKCSTVAVANNDPSKPVKCDLCSMEEGALKRTDQGGWAHVICALYIPEVQFGDVHSMDPVVLSHVPPERFDKVCYICESRGKPGKVGACMQCNKPGCKKYFHVTCAQQKGMLCEEGGGSKNVKYCGYCSHHFKKVQGDPGVKIVPAYKPVKPGSSRDHHHHRDQQKSESRSTSHNRNSSTPDSNLNKNQTPPESDRQKNRQQQHRNGPNSMAMDAVISSSSSASAALNSQDFVSTNTNHKSGHSSLPGNSHSTAPVAVSLHNNGNSVGAASSLMGTLHAPATSIVGNMNNASAARISNCVDATPGRVAGNSMAAGHHAATNGPSSLTVGHGGQFGTPTSVLLPPNPPLAAGSSHKTVLAQTSMNNNNPATKLGEFSPTSSGIPLMASNILPSVNNAGKISPSVASSLSSVATSSLNSLTTSSPSVGALGAAFANYHSVGNFAPSKPLASPGSSLIGRTMSTVIGGVEMQETMPGTLGGHVQSLGSAGPTSDAVSMLGGCFVPGVTGLQDNLSGKDPSLLLSNDIRVPGHKRGRTKLDPNDPDAKIKRPRRISNKKTVKSLLESVSHVVDETVSSFQAERVAAAASVANQQHLLNQQQQLNFSNALMGATPGPSTSSLMASQQITSMEGPLPGIATLANEVAYTQSQPGLISATPFKPIPKLGMGGTNSESGQHALPTSLEQLLERQWEQGSQFLMKQAEHFDIASLLSCLHQLKVENQRLEENIVTLAGRRDHLLAVNARLSLALGGSQQSPHSPRGSGVNSGAQQVDASTDSSPSGALSHLRSLATTISPASQVNHAKSAHSQAQASSSQGVLSPTERRPVASVAGSGSPGFGSGSGVFTTVSRHQVVKGSSTPGGGSQGQNSQEASPDRIGQFLMPRTPTPLLPGSGGHGGAGSAGALAALSSQYSALSHQDQQMMQLLALQQQAAYSAAILQQQQQQQQQPTSPHRTNSSAAALAQSAAVAAHLAAQQQPAASKS